MLKGKSPKIINKNIEEFSKSEKYAYTVKKFGKKKAHSQAVAVAEKTAKESYTRTNDRLIY